MIIMKSNTYSRSISPLVATILLIVVTVILITIIVTWGSNFTSNSLSSTKDLLVEDTDLTGFIFVNHLSNNIFNIRNASGKEVIFTKYQILSSTDLDLTNIDLTFKDPIILSSGATSTLPIICVPEGSFTISLITDQGKYVNININNILGSTNDWCEMTLVGSGSESNPYKIYNVFQLNDMRNYLNTDDINFTLEKNIDFDWISLSEFSDVSGFEDYDSNGWSPIGYDWSNYFEGNFDGKSNTIKNLYIYRPSQYYIGLFGYVKNSELKNIGLLDVNVTGDVYVSSISPSFQYSQISFCYATGNISGKNTVGGLIGYIDLSTVDSCSFSGSVYGEQGVGGLIANCFHPEIYNSYSVGQVTGNDTVGGFIGYSEEGVIVNNYSLCNVIRNPEETSEEFGPFIAMFEASNGLINNCYSIGKTIFENSSNPSNRGFTSDSIIGFGDYWDIEYSEQLSSPGGIEIGKTTDQMKQKATYVGWDFDTVWQIQEGVTYPYLRSNPQSPPPQ